MCLSADPVETKELGSRTRSAFTLLEVLLAMAIAVLLMGALYVAVSVQFRHAEAGRDVVKQATLIRGVINRIDTDIRASLASRKSGTSASLTNPATSSSSATSPSSTSNPNSSAGSASSGTAISSAPAGTSTDAVVFNLGIQGDVTHLVLYVSRIPREITLGSGANQEANQPSVSDLRRISYWLIGAGSPGGLARQEIVLVTSADAMSALPPNVPDEANYLLAEEVRSLEFSYFDGSSWQDGWDGTTPGVDGVTPMGPPLAIAIKVGVTPASGDGSDSGQPLKYYRHVVAIPTASGVPSQSTGASAQQNSNHMSP